ncbi:MAG TPA: hypothetical protein VIV58_39355 [Kofleriaceae bacterium]
MGRSETAGSNNRIFGFINAADRADRGRTSSVNVGYGLGLDAADGNDRRAASCHHGRAQTLDALDRIGVLLRPRREHRTEAEVIRAGSGLDLSDVVRADSDDQLRRDPPRIREREIGLTEVNAIRARRERDVDPIVNDQQRAGVVADLPRHSRDRELGPSIARLDPDLQHARATRADEIAGELRVVAIEDRVEPAQPRG